MSKTIIKTTPYAIDRPMQMAKMATLLKSHILKNNLFVPIMGKNYVMVEGWQFAGGMVGLFPRVAKVEQLEPGKWMAHVEIVDQKTREVISSGYAVCSKAEQKKRTFDDYAILSMAQTRAIGKAYRNLLGWVMKMAGYESTPAEEIRGEQTKNVPKEGMNKVANIMASESDKQRIIKLANEIGMKKKITGLDKLTKVEASKILFKLLEKRAKR